MISKIRKVITAILKKLYDVLCIFNLQFTLLVALVGVVLYFTGALSEHGGVLIAFCLSFIASVVLSIVLTIRKLLGLGKKKEEKSKVQIVAQQPNSEGEQIAPSVAEQPQPVISAPKYPVYYQVRQNKNYLYAEYEDRYELFQKTPQGLKRIRTDYKR